MQVLEVTPRPEAMHCHVNLCLPPAARRLRVIVHGSFLRILSTKAAPEVVIDSRALARQVAVV